MRKIAVQSARLAVLAWALMGVAHAQGKAPTVPAVNLKAGLWRVGVSMEITPRVEGPNTGPIEVDRCISPADTSQLLMVPPAANCTIERKRFTADVLEWTATCRQAGQTSVARGQLNFKDSHFDGRILTEALGMDVRVDTRVAGRYLGSCVAIKAPSVQPQPGPAQPAGPGAGGLQRYSPR